MSKLSRQIKRRRERQRMSIQNKRLGMAENNVMKLVWELEDIGQDKVETIYDDNNQPVARRVQEGEIDPYEVQNDPKFLNFLLDNIETPKDKRSRRATITRMARNVRMIIRKQSKINRDDDIDLSRDEDDPKWLWTKTFEMPISFEGLKMLYDVSKEEPPEGMHFRSVAFNALLESIEDQYDEYKKKEDAEKGGESGVGNEGEEKPV